MLHVYDSTKLSVSDILNYTPHTINLAVNGEVVELKSSGNLRLVPSTDVVVIQGMIDGVPVIIEPAWDRIEGVDKAFNEAKAVIVSNLAGQYIKEYALRTFVFAPPMVSSYVVRENGQIVKITALQRIC